MRRRAASARRRLGQIWHQQRGATAVEYGLMVAGIAVAIVVVVFSLGEDLAQFYEAIEKWLD